ncbi:winged helix-turn-helix domain-containing protein [Novisyntrophococcus fermenticellae]|uniref:winged helix-turn-helix domain-containing protein n=1 Tax=Novisyntrophococcus fermenticellae TaxID=2068655 RepID=UPI001E45D775|nr:LysR family transcriptional regulator [Novisyntrophococcus fermenticellae]
MNKKISYRMSIRIFGEGKAFGPGISLLLHRVDEFGSLQKAALSMDMAYSKAWKMIHEMEEQWGFALTERETGGRDGGGSKLTERGKALLYQYDRFTEAAGKDTGELFKSYFSEEWLNSALYY